MAEHRKLTTFPGVYARFSARRTLPDGQPDTCFEIFYYDPSKSKPIHYEKAGWVSEGMTLEKAVELRKERILQVKKGVFLDKASLKRKKKIDAFRSRTKYPGVYVRSSSKKDENGKVDKYFDIVWHIGDGKYRWKCVGSQSKGCTEEEASQIRKEIIDSHRESFSEKNKLTISEGWSIYCEGWIKNLKEENNFRRRFKRYIISQFGDKKLSDISTYDIESYKHKLLKRLNPATVKVILSDLRRVMRKIKEWNLYDGQIPKFNMPKFENDRVAFYSHQQAHDLLTELSIYSCDMYRIAKIAFYTGLRLGEVVSLRKQDIDLENRIIYTEGKTGRKESYIHGDLYNDIKMLCDKNENYFFVNRKGNPYTSNAMSTKFSKFISFLNINKGVTQRKYKLVFHCTRHSFCSWLAQDGVTLYAVQKLVGHKRIQTTQRYSKLTPDSKRAALKVIQRAMEESRKNETPSDIANPEEKP